ncbi:MAG TPA: hypothetical protein ENK53_06880 [Thiotrichales bacterium]|nr:hypothetical protein [Thiotrichales bacterium]
MDWFRVYHGISTDPKLHRAARMAKVSRGLMLGAWIACLEHASQQKTRGDVSDLDADTLAFMIDQKPAVARRILDAFEACGMIEHGLIRAWTKRQRESDNVAKRVRAHRIRNSKSLKNQETEGGCNVTGTVTPAVTCNAPDTDTESETESTPPSPLTSFGDLPPREGGAHASAPDGAPADSETGTGPPSKPARKSGSANGSRLPPDWQPSEDGLRFAASVGLPPDRVRLEAERFRDYWIAQTGARARKRDWAATWRNWCRKAADDLRRNRAPPGQPGSVLEAYRMASRLNPGIEDDDPVEHGPLQALPG